MTDPQGEDHATRERQRFDTCVCTPRNIEDGWPLPEARKRQGRSPEASESARLCQHFDFGLLASKPENKFLLCKPPNLWHFVMEAQGNEYKWQRNSRAHSLGHLTWQVLADRLSRPSTFLLRIPPGIDYSGMPQQFSFTQQMQAIVFKSS